MCGPSVGVMRSDESVKLLNITRINFSETGVVRLDNAAGIWILKGLPNNKTMVTYAWHGELLGNFPDFGLNKAWITQGTEVLTWLDKALSI